MPYEQFLIFLQHIFRDFLSNFDDRRVITLARLSSSLRDQPQSGRPSEVSALVPCIPGTHEAGTGPQFFQVDQFVGVWDIIAIHCFGAKSGVIFAELAEVLEICPKKAINLDRHLTLTVVAVEIPVQEIG